MVSRRAGYADTWDEFMTRLDRYRSEQWQKFFEQEQYNGPLAMIVCLSEEWCHRASAKDAAAKRRQRQQRAQREQSRAAELIAARKTRRAEQARDRRAAIAEAAADSRRKTINANALRPYVDEATRARMPVVAGRHQSAEEGAANQAAADAFFQDGDRTGKWQHHRATTITARTYRSSAQAWAVLHPYGPAVPTAELRQYREHAHTVRDGAARRIAPAVITPERALQIALSALGRTVR